MSKPKPGDPLTYAADIERTGIVLDRASNLVESRDYWRKEKVESQTFLAWWIHREDGTFDKVSIVARGRRKGDREWLGHYTAGGTRLDVARSAESA